METQHWLRRAEKRLLLTSGELKELRSMLEVFGPKLNAYINSIKIELKNITKKSLMTNDV